MAINASLMGYELNDQDARNQILKIAERNCPPEGLASMRKIVQDRLAAQR